MNEVAPQPKLTFLRRLRRLFWICVIPYLVISGIVALLQRSMIYHPPVLSPRQVDAAAAESRLTRWTNSAGEAIGMKRLSPTQPAVGRMLIVYGNASCATGCAHYADVVEGFGFDVYILEYPGYADRPGSPSQRSLFRAADEAFELLATNGPVYLVGESLGTGVAAYLAGAHPDKVTGVVLFAPFNSLVDVGQYHMPIFPVRLLMVDRFPSEKYLRDYHGPIAVLVAGQDQVVPEKFGRRLFDGYAGPKRLWEFPMDDHGTIMVRMPNVWKEVIEFWKANRRPI